MYTRISLLSTHMKVDVYVHTQIHAHAHMHACICVHTHIDSGKDLHCPWAQYMQAPSQGRPDLRPKRSPPLILCLLSAMLTEAHVNIRILRSMVSGISPCLGPWTQAVGSLCLRGLLGTRPLDPSRISLRCCGGAEPSEDWIGHGAKWLGSFWPKVGPIYRLKAPRSVISIYIYIYGWLSKLWSPCGSPKY